MTSAVQITLGGKPYDLPAMPLKYGANMSVFMAGAKPVNGSSYWDDEKYVQALINIVYYSLKRNYPDIDPSAVADGIDFVNVDEIILAVRDANKLVPPVLDVEWGDSQKKTTTSTGKKSSPTSPS